MNRQMNFFKKTKNQFGGSLILGKRKTARVLDTRKPIHFVLKSQKSIQLHSNRRQLRQLLFRFAKKFGVRIYSESVQKDHWHFCIKITHRILYRSFIRALTGTIGARERLRRSFTSEARSGPIALKFGKGLWIQRPFSRIVTWGRDFLNVLDYILLNECEVSGIVPYAIRKSRRQRPSALFSGSTETCHQC
jgi:REP element-mobilizing transposase RayT